MTGDADQERSPNGEPGAYAASTRAEHMAQVDPICQTFVGQETAALTACHENYKRWVRDFSKGSLKGWVKHTKQSAAFWL